MPSSRENRVGRFCYTFTRLNKERARLATTWDRQKRQTRISVIRRLVKRLATVRIYLHNPHFYVTYACLNVRACANSVYQAFSPRGRPGNEANFTATNEAWPISAHVHWHSTKQYTVCAEGFGFLYVHNIFEFAKICQN